MRDRFSNQHLTDLIKISSVPCVSFYLPTHRTGREIYGPATSLRTMVSQTAGKLEGHWMNAVEAESFLKPVNDLADDKIFWQETDLGLAVFLDRKGVKKWRVAQAFEPQCFVSKQFFVRPLIAVANQDLDLYVLSLDQHAPRLFRSNQVGISEVQVADMPENLEAALNVSSVERGSQVHTGSRESVNKQGGVFHGHGGKPDAAKADLLEYYRLVDTAVTKQLSGSKTPLFLAATEHQAATYRTANKYAHLADQVLICAAGHSRLDQMHERALSVSQKLFDNLRKSVVEDYCDKIKLNRSTSDISSVMAAAFEGRIDTLLIHPSAALPGEFDPVGLSIDYRASSDDLEKDLLESAIAQSVRHGGKIVALHQGEMPADSVMVATLRY